jgi:hypothetical protein
MLERRGTNIWKANMSIIITNKKKPLVDYSQSHLVTSSMYLNIM